MDEKKTVESLDQLFAAGDAWLRKYGMVTSIAHNAIVANLYVNFPKAKYVDYFLPKDSAHRKVWVRLHVPFWKLVFTNKDKMIDQVIDFLREYLTDYDIQVELKRYRKGVEKSDEVPKEAITHVLPEPVVEPDVPVRQASVGQSPSEPPADAAGPAPSPDPADPHGDSPDGSGASGAGS